MSFYIFNWCHADAVYKNKIEMLNLMDKKIITVLTFSWQNSVDPDQTAPGSALLHMINCPILIIN